MNKYIRQYYMLLNTASKTIIKEKLRHLPTLSREEMKFKKHKNPDETIDSVYTFKYVNQERSESLSNNLPYNTELSGYLPSINSLIYSTYNNLKKTYYYNFKLKKDVPEFETATLVIYKINNFNTIPFLQFLLYEFNGILSFIDRTASTIDEVDEFVEYIFSKESEDYPVYQGYKIVDGKCLLFYELEPSDNEEIADEAVWKWSTIHEIINIQSVFDKPVDKSIVNLFIKYNELTRLTGEDDMQLYETPLVGYSKCPQNKVNYIARFGAIRETPSKTKGPYYYFSTNFETMKQAKLETERIIRFAIFMGKSYLSLNKPLVDSDWVKLHNSLIVSEPTTNCGIAVKQLEQQVPLSIYVD